MSSNSDDQQKRFSFDFVDEGNKRLTFEYSETYDEELQGRVEDQMPVVSLNASACITVAKALLKLAHGAYPNGYRLVIREDFDGNKEDALVIEFRR